MDEDKHIVGVVSIPQKKLKDLTSDQLIKICSNHGKMIEISLQECMRNEGILSIKGLNEYKSQREGKEA